MARKKKMLIEKIATVSIWEFEGNFDQVREKLQEIEAAHPQYEVLMLDFDYDYDSYNDSERHTVVNVSGQREETDVDRAKIKLQQAELEADAKALRRVQFENLRKEFGV